MGAKSRLKVVFVRVRERVSLSTHMRGERFVCACVGVVCGWVKGDACMQCTFLYARVHFFNLLFYARGLKVGFPIHHVYCLRCVSTAIASQNVGRSIHIRLFLRDLILIGSNRFCSLTNRANRQIGVVSETSRLAVGFICFPCLCVTTNIGCLGIMLREFSILGLNWAYLFD